MLAMTSPPCQPSSTDQVWTVSRGVAQSGRLRCLALTICGPVPRLWTPRRIGSDCRRTGGGSPVAPRWPGCAADLQCFSSTSMQHRGAGSTRMRRPTLVGARGQMVLALPGRFSLALLGEPADEVRARVDNAAAESEAGGTDAQVSPVAQRGDGRPEELGRLRHRQQHRGAVVRAGVRHGASHCRSRAGDRHCSAQHHRRSPALVPACWGISEYSPGGIRGAAHGPAGIGPRVAGGWRLRFKEPPRSFACRRRGPQRVRVRGVDLSPLGHGAEGASLERLLDDPSAQLLTQITKVPVVDATVVELMSKLEQQPCPLPSRRGLRVREPRAGVRRPGQQTVPKQRPGPVPTHVAGKTPSTTSEAAPASSARSVDRTSRTRRPRADARRLPVMAAEESSCSPRRAPGLRDPGAVGQAAGVSRVAGLCASP